MKLQKSPLAVAVAAALTLSVQAKADINYTGEPIVINSNTSVGVVIEGQTITDTLDIDIQQSEVGDGVIISDSTVANAYIENNQGYIYAGEPEPLDEEDKPTGNVGVLIQDSTVTGVDAEDLTGVKVLLSNNGGAIEASLDEFGDYDAPGVVIHRSEVTGSIINENSGNQGGAIEGGHGIYIAESTFTGNIYNDDDVDISQGVIDEVLSGPDDSPLDPISVIIGQGSGILVKGATYTGNIENSGHIEGVYSDAIAVNNSDFTGDIVNAGTLKGDRAGIMMDGTDWEEEYDQVTGSGSYKETSGLGSFTGNITNNGEITSGWMGGIETEGVDITGNIINNGSISGDGAGIMLTGGYAEQGQYQYDAATDTYTESGNYEAKLARIQGNVTNNGTIAAYDSGIEVAAVNMNGDLTNTGNISAETGIAVLGGEKGTYTYAETAGVVTQDDWQHEGVASNFTGNINNSGTINSTGTVEDTAGILIENTAFNGAINNTGTISGGFNAIYIADSVTGNLLINQMDGAINGGTASAIRLNQATRVNYTGGQITGLVENDGGTFHVEGHQTINGDYEQNADATLSLGLHKATSLTANNIDLAEGSKVLIDLSSGSLYLGSGEHSVELLKVNGELIVSDISVETTSSLVEIASWTLNASGNLELVIDNTSLTEVANVVAKSGSQSGQQASNGAALAAAIDALGEGETNEATAQFLNELAELFQSDDPEALAETLNQLLPDVTGSSVGSAMSASNMSNGQISVRARGLASGDTFTKTGIWVQALAADAEQDERDGIAGYDAESRGFVLGLDGELNSGAVVGAAYSFTNTDSDSDTSSSDTDYHMLTGYWGQSYGKVLLDGQLYYAWGDNSSRRAIGATADYDSKLYGARIGTGYQLDLGNDAQLIPTLSLDYSRLSVDGYTEKGTGALSIQSEDYDRLELGLAGELNKTYQVNQMLVTPRLTLGVYHDFEAEAQSVTAAFAAAPTTTFTVTGAEPEKTRYTAGFGVEMLKGENFSADVEYNYNWQDDFDAHAGALKLRWEF